MHRAKPLTRSSYFQWAGNSNSQEFKHFSDLVKPALIFVALICSLYIFFDVKRKHLEAKAFG